MTGPRVDFPDRVMTAVDHEPAPSVTGSFVSAVRARSLGDALSAFAVAWHLGTVRRWSIGRRVRIQAIALVLSVLVALGVGSIATATGVRLAVTGVNELGNVINHQFGTNEQGDVQNNSPDTIGPKQGQDQGSQDEGAGGSGDGGGDTPGQPGSDESGGAEGRDSGAQGTDGSGGADGETGSDGPAGGEGGSTQ